jgi:hypothetical protein
MEIFAIVLICEAGEAVLRLAVTVMALRTVISVGLTVEL